jgi:hypothetical protein
MTNVLFFVFLLVNALLTWHFYRQGFVVRSNMSRKYRRRFFMLLALIGAGVSLYTIDTPAANLVLGVPAVLAILFFGLLALALLMYKGPWR